MFKYILGFVLGIGLILATVAYRTHRAEPEPNGIPTTILTQHREIAAQAREAVHARDAARMYAAGSDDHHREVQSADLADAGNTLTPEVGDGETHAESLTLPVQSPQPEVEDIQDNGPGMGNGAESLTASLAHAASLPESQNHGASMPSGGEQDAPEIRTGQEMAEPIPGELFAETKPEGVAPLATPSSPDRTPQLAAGAAEDSRGSEHALLPDELPEIAELRALFSSHPGQEEPTPPVLDAWVYAKSFNTRGQAEGFARVIAKHSGVDLDVFERGFAKYMVGIRLEQGAELDPVLERINSQADRPAPLIMPRADFRLLENNS